MTEHPQVKILGGNKQFYCDKEIANIILVLNQLGFKTYNSCQDNNGKIWINFSIKSTRKLLQIIRANDYEFLEWLENQQWTYNWSPKSILVCHNGEESIIETGDIGDSVSLRFPKEDKEKFEKYLFGVFGKPE